MKSKALINRNLRKCGNREKISNAIEKACKSARKAKCNGINPQDLFQHIPQGTKLVQWRDSPVALQASMYQLALAEIDANTEKVLIPFVFIISEELITKAYESKDYGTVSYICKRLQDSFRRTLKRNSNERPEFWFSLEMADKKRHYHIQGAIALYPNEVKRKTLARKAFYDIAGAMEHAQKSAALRFRHGKRKQLIKSRGQLATDLNWALYNTKEKDRITRRQWEESTGINPNDRQQDHQEAPIMIKLGESTVSASNKLTANAKRIHADLLAQHSATPNTPGRSSSPSISNNKNPNLGTW